MRTIILTLILLLSPSIPQAPVAHYRAHAGVQLNDLTVTPGKTVDITMDKLCTTKWGKDARHVTTQMKDNVCLAYGFQPHCYGRDTNEIDHLISRELGGADDLSNIWPQPYNQHPGAHEKDALENRLHKLVCSGSLDLKTAQTEIATDWYAAYLKYVSTGTVIPAVNK